MKFPPIVYCGFEWWGSLASDYEFERHLNTRKADYCHERCEVFHTWWQHGSSLQCNIMYQPQIIVTSTLFLLLYSPNFTWIVTLARYKYYRGRTAQNSCAHFRRHYQTWQIAQDVAVVCSLFTFNTVMLTPVPTYQTVYRSFAETYENPALHSVAPNVERQEVVYPFISKDLRRAHYSWHPTSSCFSERKVPPPPPHTHTFTDMYGDGWKDTKI